MKRWYRAVGAILFGVALIVACAATSSEGGDGETHWLKTCTADADCGTAACVCGVCTIRCTAEQAESCTGGPPGSRCFSGTDVAECAGAKSVPAGVCLPTNFERDGGGGGSANGGGGSGGHTTDKLDAGCSSPDRLVYDHPGCDGTVTPICVGPVGDACEQIVCACDGTNQGGCGWFDKPYQHLGECGDAEVIAAQCGFVGDRVSDVPLDDGCKTGVCYGVLRLAYEDLSVRGYEVISAPASPVDGTEALKTANAVFAANANSPFIPQATKANPAHAGVILVSVEPLDYGAMALVGVDSGKVIAAGSVTWGGGNGDHYWVPTEWKPAADIACSTTAATPTEAYTEPGSCEGYPDVSFASADQATTAALRTNLAASFRAHGSFAAFTYLYTPSEGACNPALAEYAVVLSQTR